MTCIFGPPWHEVSSPESILLGNPPKLIARDALAVSVPSKGVLVRLRKAQNLSVAADKMSFAFDTDVFILKGAIQTQSDHWLWPVVVDVVDATKAADAPMTRRGFAKTVKELSLKLLFLMDGVHKSARADIMSALSIDWDTASVTEISAAIENVERIIATLPNNAAFGKMTSALRNATENVARAAKKSVAASSILTQNQRALARWIGTASMAFISSEFVKRSGNVGAAAQRGLMRDVVRGHNRATIRQNIIQTIDRRLSNRDEFYFDIVASTAVSRARSYGQMVGYQINGVEWYTWESVLDKNTCEVCRFLHGQTFPVTESLQRFSAAQNNPNPDAAINEFAWYRIVGGETTPDGLRRGGDIHVQQRGMPLGPRLATVQSSGVGERNNVGTHRLFTSPRTAGGTIVPPAHGRCRCTTHPV